MITKTTRRKGLSDRQVAALPKQAKRYIVRDPELRGHYVRVMPQGANVFVAVARDPFGKQVWATIPSAADVLSIEEAREKAREAIKRIRAGKPAFEPVPVKPDMVRAVAENWIKRHVEKDKLRSQREIERCLEKYVYPMWADREFASIKRSDVARLLDHVQDKHGARQADVVLAIVRGIANWYATRNDDFVSPVARGMRRTDPKSGKRARILDDGELRTIWKAAETNGAFGALIRLLLLTVQRRDKVATMRREDVVDGAWHIPAEEREKGNAGLLALPPEAVAIIEAQPRLNDYVFAGRGDGPANGFSKAKAAFDAKLPALPNWTLHDLRRTARSLMSRAGVQRDHAERVMGHAIPGVDGVYDRYAYRDEKAEALRRLASLIETIVNPPAGNVVQLHGSEARR